MNRRSRTTRRSSSSRRMASSRSRGTARRRVRGMARHARFSAGTISREVVALGREVTDTLLGIVDNKELRAVGSEMTRSVQRVGDKMVDAVRQVGRSEAPRRLTRQTGRVIRTGARRGVETSGRMRDNLAFGLRRVGQQLARLGSRLED